MWIQLLFPLVLIAAVGLLLRGIVIGRQPNGAEVPSVRERVALRVAFLLALAPALLLLVVPTYSGLSESASASGGAPVTTTMRGTLLQANGLWALVPLSLPVVLTAAGLAARSSAQRRSVIRTAAALLTVFVVLGALSVGPVYLPAAAALWIAALSTPPAKRAT
jgi:hypothetical protein